MTKNQFFAGIIVILFVAALGAAAGIAYLGALGRGMGH